ncbi:MAG: nodulation protein NfeD [Solirubrobacterales bacterium]
MRRRVAYLALILLAVAALLAGALTARAADPAPASTTGAPLIHSVALDLTINPASADWVDTALSDAEKDGAYLVIFRLDTPGGLDDSMRKIVKDILEAPMPVVVYVSPNGSRAGSAGVFITESADVAAMAPQTNIGAATPINSSGEDIGGALGRKVTNDAAAFIRALTQAHGRNPDLAEQMVRKATSVTAERAERAGLIDLVAADQDALIRQLDGFEVKGPKQQTLHTAGARVESRDVPFKTELLELLINPTTVFLLFTLGLIGIGFEVFHPGSILPGALGGISLIVALFGLAQLPITVAGLLLILLAFGLFVAEAFIISHGALAAGGIIALAIGGLLLFDTDSEAYEVSVPIVIFTAALMGGFFAFVINKAVRARHEQVHTGHEELVGMTGEVRVALDPVGQVFVQGALWRARSGDELTIPVHEQVVVESVEGLTLTVSRNSPQDGQSD